MTFAHIMAFTVRKEIIFHGGVNPPASGKDDLNVLFGLIRQDALEITIPPAALIPREPKGEAAL